jgi:hypothetical protein
MSGARYIKEPALVVAMSSMLLLTSTTSAHHSFTGLDRERTVTIDGEVSRYVYANPHVYFFIETTDESGQTAEWQIQSGTVPLMARAGWARDTLKSGDQVAVEVHPTRGANDLRGQGISLTKSDGTALAMISSYGQQRPRMAASTSELWGMWQTIFNRERSISQASTTSMSLTEKGKAAVAEFDPSTNPALDCVLPPPPGNLGHPDGKLLERDGDVVTLRTQLYEVERVIYMDGRGHPENGQRTGQGHSIGWFEGNVLVVDTTLLQDHPWGNGDGLPSGGQKRVVERYSLSDDGTRITIEAIVKDPEYLAEAVSTVYEWGYTPDVAFIPDTGCDPDVSRYHLQ